MILFSCEECKVAYQVEEEYAGGTMDCGSCGVGISIPKTSDKKVILVYKAGESEDGVAMLQEEVERMLVSGELSDTDLAWDGETWRPLPAYLELLEDGDEKPKLSLKKQDGYAPPQPDDEFGDIEPIQKIGGAGKEGKKKDKKKTKADKKKAKAEAKKSKAEKKGKKKKEDAGEEHDGDGVLAHVGGAVAVLTGRKKGLGKLNYVVKTVLVLLVIVVGFKLGFGPLISRARHLPSYVIAYSGEPFMYDVKLGWRRMHREMYQNSFVSFEQFVGMSERQTLVVTPTEEGKGTPFKTRVPVWPGGVTVVNMRGMSTFGVFDPASVRGKKLSATEIKKLSAQLASNKAPTSAVPLSKAIQRLVKPAFKEVRTDDVFVSTQYRFRSGMVLGSTVPKEYREKLEKQSASLPLLVTPPREKLVFSGGYSVYDHDKLGQVESGISLTCKKYQLNKKHARSFKKGPTVEIRGDTKKLSLSFRYDSETVTHKKRAYRGNWAYSANCALTGSKKGQWSWRWSFTGTCIPKGQRGSRLTLNVDKNGKEIFKVKPI